MARVRGRGEGRVPLPDQADREKIARRLDRNLLVEAAAGTGKTTSMVERLIALLATGSCRDIGRMAAVTFTRKAASELWGRFQAELERATEAHPDGETGERLRAALERIETAFVGTIHSFCARLLRERPVEAGVPVDFRELDEEESRLFLARAWEEQIAGLIGGDDPLLDQLELLGLHPRDLQEGFSDFAAHQDIATWPAPEVPIPDLPLLIEELRGYVRHMATLVPDFDPDYTGRDQLMGAYRRIVRGERQTKFERAADLMELIAEFNRELPVTQRDWPQGKEVGKREKERWCAFCNDVAGPALRTWHEHRYPRVIELYRRVAAHARARRLAEGRLDFQDLLVGARDLLRDHAEVRRYFRGRYTHILVDEFQDTDPVQAEVLLLLTATDETEREWRRCTPGPGSLFVVGDPKQSIYRFRRADIATYEEVKRIIVAGGGEVVNLAANFRSCPAIIEWVNGIFAPRFGASLPPVQPAYAQLLHPGESGIQAADREPALFAQLVPKELTRKEQIAPWSASQVAATIRSWIESGLLISRRAGGGNRRTAARPGDFLVLTWRRDHLAEIGRALEREGLPHEVTGGGVLNEVPEVELLRLCLAAVVRPSDPVALVAALRGELFGLPDPVLYRYRRAGGRFSYHAAIPAGLAPGDGALLAAAFERLQRYARWLTRTPPVAALEMIADDLGLYPASCLSGGPLRSGSLGRLMEILRAESGDLWTADDLLDSLRRIVAGEESYDGMAAEPPPEAPVRVMNLHKAKGLEAPVVFLAAPMGMTRHDVRLCIDRSGSEPAGFLAVLGEARGYHRPLLAQPRGWAEQEEREESFLEAERVRLLYVAATRAGARLVVSRRGTRDDLNPWNNLEPAPGAANTGPDVGQLPVICESPAPSAGAEVWEAGEVERAARAIEERRTRILAPSYDSVAVKALTMRGDAPPGLTAGDDGAAEWGLVIHLLLETAVRRPGEQLIAVAEAALEAAGLEMDRAAEAAALVAGVLDSELWRRAGAADRRLPEVPLRALVPAGTPPAEGRPLLINGVIDLAFRESAGWVIVDYKTADRPGAPVAALADHYAPQVRLYALLWGRLTGEPISEAGIFFVNTRLWVPVTLAAG